MSPRLAGLVAGAALGVLMFAAPQANAQTALTPAAAGPVAGLSTTGPTAISLPLQWVTGTVDLILRPSCFLCHK